MTYIEFFKSLLIFTNDNNSWVGICRDSGFSEGNTVFELLKEFSAKYWNSGNNIPTAYEEKFVGLNTTELSQALFNFYKSDSKTKDFFDRVLVNI